MIGWSSPPVEGYCFELVVVDIHCFTVYIFRGSLTCSQDLRRFEKLNFFNLTCVCKGGRAQRKQRQAEEKLRPYLGRVDPGETVI